MRFNFRDLFFYITKCPAQNRFSKNANLIENGIRWLFGTLKWPCSLFSRFLVEPTIDKHVWMYFYLNFGNNPKYTNSFVVENSTINVNFSNF
jgi:hypothetical protein